MNHFIYYPKCSTCKKAKDFLDMHSISYEERNIKLENPSAQEIKRWSDKFQIPIRKFFNTSGILYRDLNLKDKLPMMSESEQLELLSSDGMLVKRPIFVTENHIIIGYKEKDYMELL